MPDPSADELKALASVRMRDAEHLLSAGRHSGAYYLAGYAVECGLKAMIAHSFRAGVIPSRRFVERIHTHNLIELVSLAGLKSQLDTDADRSAEFQAAWSVVSSWSEASRYEIIDPFRATAMVEAVSSEENGVMPWLRRHW
jgi:HEPN domain-containing protein